MTADPGRFRCLRGLIDAVDYLVQSPRMTESQIRLIVRSEVASILRGILDAIGDSPRGYPVAGPGPDPLPAHLAALAPGIELTASELRARVPVEFRQTPTRTGVILRGIIGRVIDGRVLRRRRSDRGCSLYQLEPIVPTPPPSDP